MNVSVCLFFGCAFPEQQDYGEVCLSSTARGEEHILMVEASSADCASDHEGATFDCSIMSADPGSVVVETLFQDGRDPNGACASPLRARCETAVEPGTYQVAFGDARASVELPLRETVCLPDGALPDDG